MNLQKISDSFAIFVLDVFFAGTYDLNWEDRKMKKEFEVVSQETFRYLHVFW